MLAQLFSRAWGNALWTVVLLLLLRCFWNKFGSSHLRRIPGPFLAGYTRLWYLFAVRTGELEKIQLQLHRYYGPLVRLAPHIISVDDPEAMKTIYASGPASGSFSKSLWYYAAAHPSPGTPLDLFQERDPKRHAEKRRKVALFYTMTAILEQEKYVDSCTALLIRKLTQFSESGTTVNLGDWLEFFAFDVIGEITFAERLGFMDAGRDVSGITDAIEGYNTYLTQVGIYPELHPLLHKLIREFGGNKQRIVDFTKGCMDTRIAAKGRTTDRKDFLTKFLTLHDTDPAYFTKDEVYMSCRQNLGAGSGSTAIQLKSVIYYLCKSPETLKALRHEIDVMASNGSISDPVTFAESRNMPYLQAVLKEAMRVHTSSGMIWSREVPPEGTRLAGHFIPPGTTVGISGWTAHHNKEVFGSDADEFQPQRWLDDVAARRMDRYFAPFGPAGPRTCIGKNVSIVVIGKLIPQLVRAFDFELATPGAGWKTHNMWNVRQTDFTVKIAPRNPGIAA